ncbi:MAG: lysostaphin resistance A-like protein [Pyrinomonadaceae bacterium]
MAKLFCGLLLIFVLFQVLGQALHSDRGQAGLAIGLAVLAATFLYEHLAFGVPLFATPLTVGLSKPSGRGITASVAVSIVLLLAFPIYSWLSNDRVRLDSEWLRYVPGLFAQAGIAEESLFRGYLFGHLRRTRSFWRAAMVSTGPFAAVHLILFFSMPPIVAAAAICLAVLMTFPLAYLYELGGKTIWAAAVLHFVVQGAIKVVATDSGSMILPVVWMAACAIFPYAVFFIKVKDGGEQLTSEAAA